jgi:hypothetical protein
MMIMIMIIRSNLVKVYFKILETISHKSTVSLYSISSTFEDWLVETYPGIRIVCRGKRYNCMDLSWNTIILTPFMLGQIDTKRKVIIF